MKIVIVTGGSRGIGAATARECATRGIGVVLTYNNRPEAADAVVESIRSTGGTAIALKLDLAVISSLERMFLRGSKQSGAAGHSTTWSTTPGTVSTIRSPR